MRRFLFFFLAALCQLSHADETAEKRAAAQRLVELMQIPEMYAHVNATCVSGKSTVEQDAQALFEQAPENFEGLTPSSAYWSEVIQIYHKYRVDACAASDPTRVAAIFADAYANSLTLADLDEATAYYSSPAGRRLQAGHLAASRRYIGEFYAAYEGEVAKAGDRFVEALRLLVERYKANPK